MPAASATKPAFGLTAKIFVASALLVVAVLGITFGVTSIQANRTADASIHRALLATRRAVDDYLAARTRTLGRASTVATDVPQYRQRLLNRVHHPCPDRVDVGREVVDEVVFREPAKASRVREHVRERRHGRAAGQERAQGLALVEREGGDVGEPDDVGSLVAERGHDLAAVGVAGNERGSVLHREHLAQARHVLGK